MKEGTPAAERAPIGNSPSRAALPWLLLLPAAVLAWPFPIGSPLADDPFPHLAAAGWVALLSIPAGLYLAFSPGREGGRVRGLSFLGLLCAFLVVAALASSPLDLYEAKRAVALACSWPILFLGGALLNPYGRRTFNRGLVVLSILWTGAALLRALGTDELGGVLGNTGPLSQAALPGAAVSAWYLATRRGLFFWLGCVALLGFLAHAGLAPVLAGGAALTLTLLVSSFVSPWARDRTQVRNWLGLLAAGTVFAIIGLQGFDTSGSREGSLADEELVADESAPAAVNEAAFNEGTSSSSSVARDFGGFEVRALVWASIPRMLADHALLGAGPGQFQATYPPYRSTKEIQLSSVAVCSGGSPEVDHAHNDWLQGLAELGLIGGLLWVVFLLFAARAALHALAGKDFATIATGAAATSLLFAACFHSPLTFNPAASSLAFVLFGAVLAREREEAGLRASRRVSQVAVLVVIGGAIVGWPLLGHGRMLADYITSNRAGDPRAIEVVRDLLADHPNSATARLLALQINADRETAEAALENRPHSVEALNAFGLACIRTGDVDSARASWQRALELSPTSPGVLANLARLEFLEGDSTRSASLAFEYLTRLRASGCADATWSAQLGGELVLRGRWEEGAELLFGRGLDTLIPEVLFAESKIVPAHGSAYRALAHLLWARQQIEAREFATAVRSYRQVLSPTRSVQENGAPSARAELIAAHLLADRTDDARMEARGLLLDGRTVERLPSWARAALEASGLFSAEQ